MLESGQVRLDALIRDAILNRRSMAAILADLDFVQSESSFAAAREALGEALATANIDLAFIEGEQRESKERRLTPEYVERFFVDGFRHIGGRVAAGADQDWRLDFVPADIRRAVAASNTGEFGTENRLITLRKERGRRDPPAEFVAPDHPLFDAVTVEILKEGKPALAQGTVFVDKGAREPYLVWLLQAGVVNGDGQRVHQRLVGLRATIDMHKQGVGYDFKSEGPDGQVRYIEVKGHSGTGDVTLYYTEWQTANRMREEFFIYVVENALSEPKLLIVQDPVGKGIEPVERTVEYLITADQLRAHGVSPIPADPGTAPRLRPLPAGR